jgi:hypothetical protein
MEISQFFTRCSFPKNICRTCAKFRVARWYIFKPKNPNLGKFWRALPRIENVGIFYAHLEYITPL